MVRRLFDLKQVAGAELTLSESIARTELEAASEERPEKPQAAASPDDHDKDAQEPEAPVDEGDDDSWIDDFLTGK